MMIRKYPIDLTVGFPKETIAHDFLSSKEIPFSLQYACAYFSPISNFSAPVPIIAPCNLLQSVYNCVSFISGCSGSVVSKRSYTVYLSSG